MHVCLHACVPPSVRMGLTPSGRAVELFLQRLTEGMIGVALARNNKTLSPAHL